MEYKLPDQPTSATPSTAEISVDLFLGQYSSPAGSRPFLPRETAGTPAAGNSQTELPMECREIERLALSDPAKALVRADEYLNTRSLALLSHYCPSLRERDLCPRVGMVWLDARERSDPPSHSAPYQMFVGEDSVSLTGPDKAMVIALVKCHSNLPVIWLSYWQPEYFSATRVPTYAFPELSFFKLTIALNQNQSLPNALLCVAGEEKLGYLRQIVSERRLLLSAVVLGTAQAIFNYVFEYSRKRVTFGKAICHHQAVALKLADVATDLYSARLLCHEAYSLHREPQEFFECTQNVWEYINKMALKSAVTATQLMGGHGFLQLHPVQQWLCGIQFLRQYGEMAERFVEEQ